MPAPTSQRQRWLTLAVTLGVSALAHLLLWPIGSVVLGGTKHARVPAAGGVMEVALLDQPDDPDDPDAALERKLETGEGKLVQLDRVPLERVPEIDTEHVSEFDSRVDRETRAPKQRPQSGAAAQSGDRPEGRNGRSKASSPSPTDANAKSLPLLPGANDGASDASARNENPEGRSSELPRSGGKLSGLAPAGSPGTREALRRSLGQPGTFDDLDGIDEGDETVLNSKRWKYASFFNRVRSSVSNHWHPEVLHAARDPDGSVYGTRTRRTKLIIKLNSDGSLYAIELEGDGSGVDYLDEEAIRAVRSAAPFANPPPGLVDRKTGRIEFGFGFIFEIDGGTRIFRYQR